MFSIIFFWSLIQSKKVSLNIFLKHFDSVSSKRLCSICSFLFGCNLNTDIVACKNILLLRVQMLGLLSSLQCKTRALGFLAWESFFTCFEHFSYFFEELPSAKPNSVRQKSDRSTSPVPPLSSCALLVQVILTPSKTWCSFERLLAVPFLSQLAAMNILTAFPWGKWDQIPLGRE